MGPAELDRRGRDSRANSGARAWRVPATSCSRRTIRRSTRWDAPDARAAPDRDQLGKHEAPEGDARGQGRVLRHRRPRHQDRRGHAAHEEGHGRRRVMLGSRGAHGGKHADPPARARSRGREFDRRQRLSSARHHPHAPRPDGRDRQHRRRGPPHPLRRARRGRQREAGAAHRLRDADRCSTHRARPRGPGAVLRRRRAADAIRAQASTSPIRSGACRSGSRIAS